MKEKLLHVLTLLLISCAVAHAFSYSLSEDPKSFVSRLRYNYNFSYETTEIEGKVATRIPFIKHDVFNFGLLGSVTLFIRGGRPGRFPVNNLYGAFSLYAEFTNMERWKFNVHLTAHESAHLVDGYSEESETADVDDDSVVISNEYMGVDVFYIYKRLQLAVGNIWWFHKYNRDLLFRFHIGEDFRIPINDNLNVLLASHFAIFYEGRFHPAVNIGAGIENDDWSLLAHFEYQYGIAHDWEVLQKRLGIELVIPYPSVRKASSEKTADSE